LRKRCNPTSKNQNPREGIEKRQSSDSSNAVERGASKNQNPREGIEKQWHNGLTAGDAQ